MLSSSTSQGGDDVTVATATGPAAVRHAAMKFSVLVLLCLQNAGHGLMSRYSQGILKETYSTYEVVFISELLKMAFSLYFVLTDTVAKTDAVGSGLAKLRWLIFNSNRIILVVIMYAINNILTYYALARVEASVYAVLLQLKVFTTAAFAVFLYRQQVSKTQWRALVLLLIGCILVVSPALKYDECAEILGADGVVVKARSLIQADLSGAGRVLLQDTSIAATSIFQDISIKLSFTSIINRFLVGSDNRSHRNLASSVSEDTNATNDSIVDNRIDTICGIVAVIVMACLSGFAGVYLENTVKDKNQVITIWERNFQLAFYSIVVLVGMIIWENYYNNYYADYNYNTNSPTNPNSIGAEEEDFYMPFRGWSINTIIIVLLQTMGGICVAFTLKYADSILKTLATCGAIVISTILGWLLLGGTLDLIVALGCISTLLAIVNYNFIEKG